MPDPSSAVVIEPDTDKVGGGEDVVGLHSAILIGSGSFPPKETTRTLLARFERSGALAMNDSENDSYTFFDVQEVACQVVVIYWLRRASSMRSLIPIFGETCKEVMRRYPDSGSWPIFGDFPGEGLTPSQRRRSSYDMVTAWRDYFNSSPTVGVFAERLLNPQNTNQFRLKGTVSQAAAFADWAQSQ